MGDKSNDAEQRRLEMKNRMLPMDKASEPALAVLADQIVKAVMEARASAVRQVNAAMGVAYWNVGRHIVEFEQHGNAKAQYGTRLLANLSKLLSLKLGRGYSRPNLNNMRKFYLTYPICQNVLTN